MMYSCTLWSFSIHTLIIVLMLAFCSTGQNLTGFDASQLANILKAHEFEKSYRASSSVSDDSFYSLPEGADAAAPPGTLFKVESVTNTSKYALAPNLSLSRFMYQSETSNGTLVPVTGYVLWPYIVRNHAIEGYPVVVVAHGTSGANDECAPSNVQNLWHHFQIPYTLALNGYVVVATDYAGLGIQTDFKGNHIVHEYLIPSAQANDVLNSITAAQVAFAELSQEFILIGSSQGGAAVWSCAEQLATTPMPGYLGTISLSPVLSLSYLSPDAPITALINIMLLPGMLIRNATLDPSEILSAGGLDCYNAYFELHGCNTVLFNLPVNETTLTPGWNNTSAYHQYVDLARVGNKPFAGPMLVMTGAADPWVPPDSVVNVVQDTAKVNPNESLEFHLLPNVSHAPAMYSGWQIYSKWIQERFDGVAAQPGFEDNSSSVVPIRNAASQQIEANWYIQNFTATWQLT